MNVENHASYTPATSVVPSCRVKASCVTGVMRVEEYKSIRCRRMYVMQQQRLTVIFAAGFVARASTVRKQGFKEQE